LTANARQVKQIEAAKAQVGAQAGTALQAAQQAVDGARETLAERKRLVEAAQAALAAAEGQVHSRQGEATALQRQLEALDRQALLAKVEAARTALEAFGAGPITTHDDVLKAEAELARATASYDEANEDFLKVDGALASLAGPMAKEGLQRLDEAIHAARNRERELSVDADSWKLLRDALREAEKTESAHLGKTLAVPVAARFTELTRSKYAGVQIDQELRVEAVQLDGHQASADSVLAALSVGTRDQLATLIRLSVASQLKTAIVLDDQLVHTDQARLGWFADVLEKVAQESQVLVFTCRPLDYLEEELPPGVPARDAGGTRAIDLAQLVSGIPPRSPG
jgi:uncharacterized protein YhaN